MTSPSTKIVEVGSIWTKTSSRWCYANDNITTFNLSLLGAKALLELEHRHFAYNSQNALIAKLFDNLQRNLENKSASVQVNQGDFLIVLESSVDCVIFQNAELLMLDQKARNQFKNTLVKVFHLNSSTTGYIPKIFLIAELGWVRV